MSDFGNTPTARLTSKLTEAIREHLKTGEPPNENHHYNRAFEKIFAELSKLPIPVWIK